MFKAALAREYTPERNPRRAAPHPAAITARFRFGAPQFVEARQRCARGDARETVAHELGVDEQAVFAEDVREPAAIRVDPLPVLLEAHPAMEDHLSQAIARLLRERRRGVEPVPQFGRIDAEQADAAELRDGDCVAVENGGYDHRLGSFGSSAERHGLNNCHGRCERSGQNLHTHLRWRGIARNESAFLQTVNRGSPSVSEVPLDSALKSVTLR